MEGICPGAAGLFSSDGDGVGLLQEGEPNQASALEIMSGKNVSKIPSENLSCGSPILLDLNCHVPFKFSYICRKRCNADVRSGCIHIPWLSASLTHVTSAISLCPSDSEVGGHTAPDVRPGPWLGSALGAEWERAAWW